MLQPLNFFAPYSDIPGHYENQLTRGLLVVLRYSPIAHAAWLSLVDGTLRVEQLPAAVFRTQQARPVSFPRTGDSDVAIRGLSVFVAPDPVQVIGAVRQSERSQILDAIIEYGDELVIVVENKITAGGRTDQPTMLNTHGVTIDFDPNVRVISWQRLLECFADIAARELATGAELKLLEDFLEFAEHHFPQIGPYSTLRRAAKSVERVTRRLDAALAEAVGVQERPGQGIGWRDLPEYADGRQRCVEMVSLGFEKESDRVVLRMYPGDTLAQARALYVRGEPVRRLLSLDGWQVNPNYHWGFRTSGYCWSTGQLEAKEYIEFWLDRINRTIQVPRVQWETYWSELEAQRIVSHEDKPEFNRCFTKTRIPNATPRPGLKCQYVWSMSEAMRLDDEKRFVGTVRARVLDLLQVLEEPLPVRK